MATSMTVETLRESIALALGDAIIERWPLCNDSWCRSPCDDSSHAADKQIVRDYESVAEVLQNLTDEEVIGLLARTHSAGTNPTSSNSSIALRNARRRHPSARGPRSRPRIVTAEPATMTPRRKPRPAMQLSEATGRLIRTRAGTGDWRNGRCEACGEWLGGDGGACQPRTLQCRAGGSPADLDSPANGTLLCGTPSQGCYGRCVSRDFDMAVAGFWLGPEEDPALTPIQWHGIEQSGLTLWLGTDGTYRYEPPPRAQGGCP